MTGPLLLDTHILLEAMGDFRMTPKIARQIERAAQRDELLVSVISAWEIAMLASANRVRVVKGLTIHGLIERCLDRARARIVPTSVAICVEAGSLAGLHGDPADRIITATARLEDATLVTRDQRLLDYGEAGGVKTLEP